MSGSLAMGSVAIPIGIWIMVMCRTKRKVRNLVTFALPMVLCAVWISYYTTIDESLRARCHFWKDTISIAQKGNVWTGWGVGNFKQIVPRAKTSYWTEAEGKLYEAHNEYLQVFFETGIVGLVLVVLFIGDILRRFFSCYLDKRRVAPLMASFMSILVISFFAFPFHMASTAFISLSIIFIFDIEMGWWDVKKQRIKRYGVC